MIDAPVRYTQAARYVSLLKQLVPSNKWEDVCADIQVMSDMLKSNKAYVHWASKNPSRWDYIIGLTEYPELAKLLQLLKKDKNITFIIDIANELAEKHRYILVEHAGEKPRQEQKVKVLASSVWSDASSLLFERNDSLVDGIRLTHGKQTFDTSFRQYRHNLIAKLRQA